ncbi:Uu.00g033040.m01.CDS01 [Anthostomella pinea]|uniref:Uu.00g033040.m01.CDS01 n=1 Tax=Anthostomella pinea TaxID=933095 RepID=A0AAI8V8S9_9PEZI|nr:Uu.00g033040.m01.CDS01 [Anthostomella pinea]
MAVGHDLERYLLRNGDVSHPPFPGIGGDWENNPARPRQPRLRVLAYRDLRSNGHGSDPEQSPSPLSQSSRQGYQQSYPRPDGGWRLDNLPRHLTERTSQHVPYYPLMQLRLANKMLRALVHPHASPEDEGIAYVLRAERDFTQHINQSPFNMGCYICYRVLPARCFDKQQALHALRDEPLGKQTIVKLRRFCIQCGLRTGLHGTGDRLRRWEGGNSWICNCERLWSDMVANCVVCRLNCPFRDER